jgi:hypothetical protein
MPRDDIERLIGRVILDEEFRKRLFADPGRTIREAGLSLTDQEMAALESVDPEQAAEAIENLLAASAQPWAG